MTDSHTTVLRETDFDVDISASSTPLCQYKMRQIYDHEIR
jgi:hypothetical protein